MNRTYSLLCFLFIICSGYGQAIKVILHNNLGEIIPAVMIEQIEVKSGEKKFTFTDMDGKCSFIAKKDTCIYNLVGLGLTIDSIYKIGNTNWINIKTKSDTINYPSIQINRNFTKYKVDSTNIHLTNTISFNLGNNDDYQPKYTVKYAVPRVGIGLFYKKLFSIIKAKYFLKDKVEIYFKVHKSGEMSILKIQGINKVKQQEYLSKSFYSISKWESGSYSRIQQESIYKIIIYKVM